MASTDTIAQMHRFDFAADDLASARVRRDLEGLDYDFAEETVELLKLAATELVTNAARHSGTDAIIVYVRVGAPSLLVKVCDRGPGVPSEAHAPDLFAEGGRGLFLVEAVSRSWGTSQVEIDGNNWSCVWACFGAEALPGCISASG